MLAAERAALLLGGYRRSDANDPEIYVTSIAMVLAEYAEEIIIRVTDPRVGISTHDKYQSFPPNSGELKSYCDAYAAHAERMKNYKQLPPFKSRPVALPAYTGERPPGRLGNLLIRKETSSYAAMVQRAETADPADWRMDEKGRGIWVPFSWWGGGGLTSSFIKHISRAFSHAAEG